MYLASMFSVKLTALKKFLYYILYYRDFVQILSKKGTILNFNSSNMYIDLHVLILLCVADFDETWIFKILKLLQMLSQGLSANDVYKLVIVVTKCAGEGTVTSSNYFSETKSCRDDVEQSTGCITHTTAEGLGYRPPPR